MRKKVLPMGKRIHYLDNLRTCLVFAGICFAALGNFRPFPLLHPYVPAPMHSIEGLAIDFLYNLAIVCIVPAIFFISAYFGASSLRIHMIRPYFKSKWTRLGWPWLAGTILLAPELLYLASRSCGSHGDGPAFSIVHLPFWSAYFQSPFFCIGLLLLFHLALMGAKKWRRSLFQRAAAAPPSAGILAGFYALQLIVAAAFFGLLLAAHRTPDLWFPLYVLYLAAMSGLYFCFGVYAFRHRWFTAGGYVPSAVHIIGAALLLGVVVALSYISMGISVFISGTLFPLLLFFSILQLPLLLALLAAFAKWGDIETDKTKLAAGLAYPLYVVSDTLIQNTAYFLQPLSLGTPLKFVLTLALSFLYGYMICKYALRHLPCFKTR